MISEVFEKTVLQNTVLDYIIFLVSFLAGMVIIKILKSVVIKRLKVWSEQSATSIDDFLIKIVESKLVPLLYFGVFYITFKSLSMTEAVKRVVDVTGIILLTFLIIRLIIVIINYLLETYFRKKSLDVTRQHNFRGIITIVKVIIWGAGITFLLDNLGFKISAVIAGLGIGGIAVALAAQTILGDLFSYFVIFFDRPFEVGDFIITGDYMGSIEHIGIKTTRVRSLGGEQLVFSNTDLTNSRIRNYKRMEKRRVLFSVGVVYQTSTEQVKEIPGIIRQVIEQVNDTVFDRAHFSSYGDFSLNFEIVYYVLSSDYNKYMDIQQEINFQIKEEFEQRGIEFAYPTQTLFMEKPWENS
ncbi:MAG: mechanosensitive ion channel family protein [Nitrospiraceae bacterium]|nr:MAG: mechanosensitive ion channel family protein [Nitrospiraceae bacterium]